MRRAKVAYRGCGGSGRELPRFIGEKSNFEYYRFPWTRLLPGCRWMNGKGSCGSPLAGREVGARNRVIRDLRADGIPAWIDGGASFRTAVASRESRFVPRSVWDASLGVTGRMDTVLH